MGTEVGTATRAADLPHIVLVGKGITFDSGGLSLKPREMMPPMKTDMSGAAAVMAALVAATLDQVPVRITGLLACADNLVSGSAYRPGDVVAMYGGTTVEVINTDAEGRMVLADALAYAHQHLNADALIDIATLTGAASLGLGKRHGALFSPDAALREQFIEAGQACGERVWPLPLVPDYRASLHSEVADLAHVSTDPEVMAGAITAALFLQRFAEPASDDEQVSAQERGAQAHGAAAGTSESGEPAQPAWVHLDIAGPARADGDDGEVSKGGTGFGARLLAQWLRDYAPAIRDQR